MNAISHVAIGVRDMERSLRFYRDLLGLEVMSDQTQPIGNMPVNGRIQTRMGNALRDYAPTGVYPCARHRPMGGTCGAY